MNKIIKTLLAISLGSLTTMSSYAKEVLVVWEDVNKGYSIAQAVSSFEKEYDCEVIIKEYNPVYHIDEFERAKDKNKPDVFIILSDKLGYAVEKGLIQSIDSMKTDRHLFIPESISPFTIHGNIYAEPRSIESLVVYYNRNIISYPYYGFDDYEKLARARQKLNKYSILAKFDNFYYTYGFISGFGGYIFGKNNDGGYNLKDIGLNSDDAIDAVEYIWNYTSNYQPSEITSDKGFDVIDDYFISGRAAAVISGPWSRDKYEKSSVDFGVASLPFLPNGKRPKPFYGVKGYVVASSSKHKDLAMKFVRHLNEPVYAMMRFLATGELPPTIAVVTNPLISSDELACAVLTQIKDAQAMPSIPSMNKVWKSMDDALSDVITGKKATRDALNEAVDAIKLK